MSNLEKSSILNKIVDPTSGCDVLDFESMAENDKKVERMNDAINSSLYSNISNIGNYTPRKPIQQIRGHKKISRNQSCPCGSGKKYKNCCLDSGRFEYLKDVEK